MGQQQIESMNQSSQKGMKPFDLGGIGLGIVAALGNSCDSTNNRMPANKATVLRRNICRTKPIPASISSSIIDDDGGEEYTIVTCRDPKESCTTTKVFTIKGNRFRVKNHQSSSKAKRVGIFQVSPAKSLDFSAGATPTTSDGFLSSCNMCRKKLHGLDIYMYRGARAFCSSECRHKQIVIDERKEKYCSTEASKQVRVDASSSSPNAKGQILAAEILAS